MVDKAPVIVLAFANEYSEKGFLRQLTREMKRLLLTLEPAVQKGRCHVKVLPAATQEEIAEVFQDEWYQGRIWVFHYAGHADEDELWLEGEAGGNKSFFSLGLARFLGAQKDLKLVFLNACATREHATLLQEAGIPAVVATSRKIQDAQAQAFAEGFYRGLAGGASILESYQEAEGLLLGEWGDIWKGEADSTRSIFWENRDPNAQDFPWKLEYQEGSNLFVDYWRLFYELPPDPMGKELAEADFVGRKIQNYTIKSFLGAGRFGSVYTAEHDNVGNEVAIKISHPVIEGYEELKDIIFSGNQGLSSLRHPNVVAFFDAGEVDFEGDKRIYVVMELVKGKRLDKMSWGVPFLDKDGLSELADLAIQICEGMHAAHTIQFTDSSGIPREGFIHGNLKTRKILFTPDGKPKIIDFLFADLARSHKIQMKVPERVKEFAKAERLEDTYPPEVISGQRTINKQTDIYAFGAIMVEILFDKKLSEVSYVDAASLQAQLEDLNHKIPKHIGEIIFNATQEDPTKRTQQFTEISAALMKPRSFFRRISYLLRKKI